MNSDMFPIGSCIMKVPDLNHRYKDGIIISMGSVNEFFNENMISLSTDSSAL